MTIWTPDLTGRGLPLYRALAQAIAESIDRGELRPGQRLPTQRALSDRLGTALTTVTRGYGEAERLGLVNGEVGRGTFVRIDDPDTPADDQVDLRANSLLPDPFLQELRQELAHVMTSSRTADYGYGAHRGSEEDRQAAAHWLSTEASLPTTSERMLITAGAQHAMAVVFATLLDPGDTLLVEESTYAGMKSLANLLRIRLQPLLMDAEGILPEALKTACQDGAAGLYTVPTFQNPTSAVMGERRRRDIARIANAVDLPVVEDDSYGFLLPGRTPLTAHCEKGYYLTGTSKSLLPALRIGFLRAPTAMVERLEAAIAGSVYLASPLMAAAVSKWVHDGIAMQVVEWKRAEVRARQEIARRAFPAELYQAPPSSPHGWLTLPEPWAVREFVSQAAMRGVHVMPADYYAVGRSAPHAVRLCVGPATGRPQLERAVETLATLLQEGPDAGRVIV